MGVVTLSFSSIFIFIHVLPDTLVDEITRVKITKVHSFELTILFLVQ